jgi:TolB-like protein
MNETSPPDQSEPNSDTSPHAVAFVSPWTRIKEHKVLQWTLAYLGAALALAHGQELLAHNFHWSESVGHVLTGVLIVGLPIVVALAWYHGHRGLTRIGAGEMTVIALLLVIGAGLLIALVGVPEQRGAQAGSEATAAASAPAAADAPGNTAISVAGKPRIAILPFENLSPDPANAYFTDGLYEEILATLSNGAPGLEVISRTTMMIYRATPKPVAAIAKELGATHVLEGSVRRDGNAVRLTLQLINARTDEHIWSHDYNRTLADALTLQSQVANDVTEQLAEGFGGVGTNKPLTRDPQAYDLYLKARLSLDAHFRNGAGSVDDLHDTIAFADAAVARDSSFAAPLVMRMLARLVLFAEGFDTSENAVQLMRGDVEAAERLAPQDPQVLDGRGSFEQNVEFDVNRALPAYRAAEAAGFADPPAIVTTADAFMAAGDVEEALARAQRGMALSQGNPTAASIFTGLLQMARRPAEALRIADTLSPGSRAYIIWQETGSAQALAQLANAAGRSSTEVQTRSAFDSLLLPLRLQQRYRALTDRIDQVTVNTLRPDSTGLEQWPVAEWRGWAHLLAADGTPAQDGREVLDFVAHVPPTPWNRTFRQLLTAEGNLFVGNREQAQQQARQALAEMPAMHRSSAAPKLAQVLAWAGATEEAAGVLEQLTTQTPRFLSPAELVQDPLYSLPLAKSARYQALRARLEAQMAATRLE